MPVTVASLQAVLGLDNKQFNEGLKQAGGKLNSFASDFAKGFGMGLGISAFDLGAKAVSALGQTITGSIGAAREAIAVNKQLEAVLKSTGGAAGLTADELRGVADRLSQITNFDDDAILGAENLLLTFTKIKGTDDIFQNATVAILNMSAAMGQDLKSSAIQVGKALNDPVKGIGALSRVGVSFTEQQKEMIKNFAKQGEMSKAQAIILSELGTEFGGMARALADPIIILGNAFGNLQEKFGTNVLLPVLNSLAQVVLPGVNAAIDSFKASIASLTEEEIASLSKTFTDFIGILGEIGSAFNELGKGIVATARGLGLADQNSTGLGLTVAALGKVIGALLQPIVLIAKVLTVLGAALQVVGVFTKIVGTGFDLLGNSIGNVASKSTLIMAVWNALTAAGNTLYQIIKIIEIAWRNLINAMSQRIGLPPVINPGSPTPLEMGLRGIASAINDMPSLNSAFGGGMVPTAAGAGGGSNITVNIGGVSATSTTNGDPASEAIRLTIQMLREQLNR